MANENASFIESVLGNSVVSRVRRNHGLEHATLHILAERNPHLSMAGHSDANGFWLLGDVDTEDVKKAVHEALNRMRNGEENLAVHPNCGTNFVAAGTVAGLAGALSMFGVGRKWQDKVERLPLAMTLATLGLIMAQPLGLKLQQKITTSGVPGDLEIVDVTRSERGKITAHRVLTRG